MLYITWIWQTDGFKMIEVSGCLESPEGDVILISWGVILRMRYSLHHLYKVRESVRYLFCITLQFYSHYGPR